MFLCLLSGCTEVSNENDVGDDDEVVVDESLIEDGWDEPTGPSTPVVVTPEAKRPKSPLAESVTMAHSERIRLG